MNSYSENRAEKNKSEMDKPAWRAVSRYFKVKTSFKDYWGGWLTIIIAVLALLIAIIGATAFAGNFTEVLTLALATIITLIGIGVLTVAYVDAVSGKRLRLRLLPNGYFIYGAVNFIGFTLFGLLIVLLSCGFYVAVHLGGGWQWALKTVLAMTVLLLALAPWGMLLSTLIKGIGSFIAIYMLTVIPLTFIAPMTVGKIEFPFPFSFIPKLYYPLKVLLSWCTGNSEFYNVGPCASTLTAFGIFVGVGLVGYVLMAAFYRRLLGSPSIASTTMTQAKLGKSTKIGKGW